MEKSIVAIIGRPNVGKSTLFNRLAQKRHAIIDKVAGVTRDRIYHEIEWCGQHFIIIDTGGVDTLSQDNLNKQVLLQTQAAIEESDIVIFLVDGKTGLMPGDHDIANLIRRQNKTQVILAVNKIDSIKEEINTAEFHQFGFNELVSLSALRGDLGVGDLLDIVVNKIDPNHHKTKKKFEIIDLYENIENENFDDLLTLDLIENDENTVNIDTATINFCLIGKPNAGKSSLFNALLKKHRSIVDSISGTTRDSVNWETTYKNRNYCLVDTAGIRKKSKVGYSLEGFAVVRALKSLSACDVAVLVIDATLMITDQDQKIAAKIVESGKACVIVVNKWDLIEDKTLRKNMTDEIRTHLRNLNFAPILFLSALKESNLPKIFEAVELAYKSSKFRVGTSPLNEVIHKALTLSPPPALKRGKRLKVYYVTQVSVSPPSFVLFVNDKGVFQPSYETYLERKIREAFDFKGTPIRLFVRPKINKRK